MKKRLWISAVIATMALVLSSCGESTITDAKAKEIALAEAGVTAEAVQGLTAHLERDDGREYYEVDFYVDAVEYDIDVDAETGEIIRYDRDGEKATTTVTPTTAAPTTAAPTTADTAQADTVADVTQEKAKEIALAKAGVKSDKAEGLTVHKDRDDGKVYYDVDFYADGVEYDVEVDAQTGEVLKFETEKHPVDKPTKPTKAVPKVREDEAKATALADAGVAADAVKRLTVKLDYDDGKAHYDIEFVKDGTEYDYEIDGETGKILSKDIDKDNR